MSATTFTFTFLLIQNWKQHKSQFDTWKRLCCMAACNYLVWQRRVALWQYRDCYVIGARDITTGKKVATMLTWMKHADKFDFCLICWQQIFTFGLLDENNEDWWWIICVPLLVMTKQQMLLCGETWSRIFLLFSLYSCCLICLCILTSIFIIEYPHTKDEYIWVFFC